MEIKHYYKDSGLWALILGGSSGMGLACAKKFATQGLHIMLVHRDTASREKQIEATCRELAETTGVKIIRKNTNALLETAVDEVVEHMVREVGLRNLRVLVHSVASGNLKPVLPEAGQDISLTENDFQYTIHAMGYSILSWVKKIHHAGLFQEHASVLGFTSEGSSRVLPNYAAVAAAKSVLESVFKSMAVEFASAGVRFNLIQPGITDTDALRKIPGHENLIKFAVKRNPFHTLTTPDHIANIAFLVTTEEAVWVNGAILRADGGEALL